MKTRSMGVLSLVCHTRPSSLLHARIPLSPTASESTTLHPLFHTLSSSDTWTRMVDAPSQIAALNTKNGHNHHAIHPLEVTSMQHHPSSASTDTPTVHSLPASSLDVPPQTMEAPYSSKVGVHVSEVFSTLHPVTSRNVEHRMVERSMHSVWKKITLTLVIVTSLETKQLGVGMIYTWRRVTHIATSTHLQISPTDFTSMTAEITPSHTSQTFHSMSRVGVKG